jgi:hypothetical protein
MLTTTSSFDTKHDLAYKTPVCLVHFDGEAVDYVNHECGSPDNTLKKYLVSISSLSRTVTPEEGKSSVSGVNVTILDYNDEITALLATDTYYFHRKKTTIKIGYAGTNESDMVTVLTGWVTGLKLTSDGLAYEFSITDPIKWMQRKIFRGAEDSTVTISGNPINILLACLTSTGAGTNGDYDYYAEENGLGIDDDYIDVTGIEAIRDDWFPGASHYMNFTITKRQKAKDFFEKEIFKPLNLYPIVSGTGKFLIKRFAPPLITSGTVQSFDEDNIIGLPSYDMNLDALVNEVEFFYDYSTDFDTEAYYISSTSLNNRGPGKKPIEIKSKGFDSDKTDVANIAQRRANAIFNRFAVPPIKLNINAFFDRWITEVGDIVPITHSKLPNIESGTRGLDESRMEIIKKDVDFKNGRVKFEALNTGFAKDIYCVISPSMTVTAGASGTEWTVSVADAAKYANFTNPEVRVSDAGMRSQAVVTITAINTVTGVCTSDNIGATPSAGWIVNFADYDSCTDEQKLYWFLSDGSDQLGAANDPAQLIVP